MFFFFFFKCTFDHRISRLTCSACRSPACDPSTGPSSRRWRRRRGRHRRAQTQHPPAWFTFPGGRAHLSPLSVRICSPPGSGALCRPQTFLCPAAEQKTAAAAATLGYSTAWEENILRCLISTVGKAILTKPINPWASDGTDLIPPAADVPASLCTAVLW